MAFADDDDGAGDDGDFGGDGDDDDDDADGDDDDDDDGNDDHALGFRGHTTCHTSYAKSHRYGAIKSCGERGALYCRTGASAAVRLAP